MGRWKKKTLQEYVFKLLANNQEIGVSLIKAVRRTAATPEFLIPLIQVLRNEVWYGYVHEKQAVINAFVALGEAAAIPEMLVCLEEWLDSHWSKQRTAIVVIGAIGSAAATPNVLSRLNELSHKSDYASNYAQDALKRLTASPEPPAHLQSPPSLTELWREYPTPAKTIEAISALGSTVATSEILNRLLELSHNTSLDVQRAAIKAIGKLGSGAATPDILYQLPAWLNNTDLRKAVVEAIGGLGSEAASPEVINQLSAWLDSTGIRKAVIKAISGLGRIASTPEILTQLAIYLDDVDDTVRIAVAEALTSMMSDGVRFFPDNDGVWHPKDVRTLSQL